MHKMNEYDTVCVKKRRFPFGSVSICSSPSFNCTFYCSKPDTIKVFVVDPHKYRGGF